MMLVGKKTLRLMERVVIEQIISAMYLLVLARERGELGKSWRGFQSDC